MTPTPMRIIPAIDIIDGKCVRLTKGDYGTKKIYGDNPLDVAKEFEDNGIKNTCIWLIWTAQNRNTSSTTPYCTKLQQKPA